MSLPAPAYIMSLPFIPFKLSARLPPVIISVVFVPLIVFLLSKMPSNSKGFSARSLEISTGSLSLNCINFTDDNAGFLKYPETLIVSPFP